MKQTSPEDMLWEESRSDDGVIVFRSGSMSSYAWSMVLKGVITLGGVACAVVVFVWIAEALGWAAFAIVAPAALATIVGFLLVFVGLKSLSLRSEIELDAMKGILRRRERQGFRWQCRERPLSEAQGTCLLHHAEPAGPFWAVVLQFRDGDWWLGSSGSRKKALVFARHLADLTHTPLTEKNHSEGDTGEAALPKKGSSDE